MLTVEQAMPAKKYRLFGKVTAGVLFFVTGGIMAGRDEIGHFKELKPEIVILYIRGIGVFMAYQLGNQLLKNR